jgi:hypothetical protein
MKVMTVGAVMAMVVVMEVGVMAEDTEVMVSTDKN